MNECEQKRDILREKVRDFRERSSFTYKIIAEKLHIPYSSFRNFMYGCRISEDRYTYINTAIDKMIEELPW